jgi:hypothetical protein
VAKKLFATKRARPDTGTAISFLTTRVSKPTTDDWKKLSHMMRYLRGTKSLPLILSANGSGMLKWWIDGSHGVHPNMRGHTGCGLSMGQGFPISASSKQKLNTRSSTETELVGVDDFMPSIMWSRLFLEAQGYGVTENIIFQDNQAAILLEKNGKASSGKRTKHLNMRYFFVTDRIANRECSVEWCPTGDMTGDFLTKPLQGALFTRFRDLIMGVVAQPDPGPGKPKPVKAEAVKPGKTTSGKGKARGGSKSKSTNGKGHGDSKSKSSSSAAGKKVRSRRSVLGKPALKVRGKGGGCHSRVVATGGTPVSPAVGTPVTTKPNR